LTPARKKFNFFVVVAVVVVAVFVLLCVLFLLCQPSSPPCATPKCTRAKGKRKKKEKQEKNIQKLRFFNAAVEFFLAFSAFWLSRGGQRDMHPHTEQYLATKCIWKKKKAKENERKIQEHLKLKVMNCKI
jgi:hypothetical protein